jgi:hypothetical protein
MAYSERSLERLAPTGIADAAAVMAASSRFELSLPLSVTGERLWRCWMAYTPYKREPATCVTITNSELTREDGHDRQTTHARTASLAP